MSLFPGISQDEERTLQLCATAEHPEPVQGCDSVSQLIGLLTPSIATAAIRCSVEAVSTYPLVGMPFIRWPADADPTDLSVRMDSNFR